MTPSMTLEEALDWFRAEGGWEPQVAGGQGVASLTHSSPRFPNPGTVQPKPGRFVNQCGRCLSWEQAARVDLSKYQRVWLCAACAGPNPPEVFAPPKEPTLGEIIRADRKRVKDAERERKKLEREEAKARRAALPRVRKPRATAGNKENAVSQGPQNPAVSV